MSDQFNPRMFRILGARQSEMLCDLLNQLQEKVNGFGGSGDTSRLPPLSWNGGHFVGDTVQSDTVANKPFRAKLTAVDYTNDPVGLWSWVEQYPSTAAGADGAGHGHGADWSAADGPRFGYCGSAAAGEAYVQDPAYEANNRPATVGDVVQMRRAYVDKTYGMMHVFDTVTPYLQAGETVVNQIYNSTTNTFITNNFTAGSVIQIGTDGNGNLILVGASPCCCGGGGPFGAVPNFSVVPIGTTFGGTSGSGSLTTSYPNVPLQAGELLLVITLEVQTSPDNTTGCTVAWGTTPLVRQTAAGIVAGPYAVANVWTLTNPANAAGAAAVTMTYTGSTGELQALVILKVTGFQYCNLDFAAYQTGSGVSPFLTTPTTAQPDLVFMVAVDYAVPTLQNPAGTPALGNFVYPPVTSGNLLLEGLTHAGSPNTNYFVQYGYTTAAAGTSVAATMTGGVNGTGTVAVAGFSMGAVALYSTGSSVGQGTYNNASFTVNSCGQIMAASSCCITGPPYAYTTLGTYHTANSGDTFTSTNSYSVNAGDTLMCVVFCAENSSSFPGTQGLAALTFNGTSMTLETTAGHTGGAIGGYNSVQAFWLQCAAPTSGHLVGTVLSSGHMPPYGQIVYVAVFKVTGFVTVSVDQVSTNTGTATPPASAAFPSSLAGPDWVLMVFISTKNGAPPTAGTVTAPLTDGGQTMIGIGPDNSGYDYVVQYGYMTATAGSNPTETMTGGSNDYMGCLAIAFTASCLSITPGTYNQVTIGSCGTVTAASNNGVQVALYSNEGTNLGGAAVTGGVLFTDDDDELSQDKFGNLTYDPTGLYFPISSSGLGTPNTLYVGGFSGNTAPGQIALWDNLLSTWYALSVQNGVLNPGGATIAGVQYSNTAAIITVSTATTNAAVNVATFDINNPVATSAGFGQQWLYEGSDSTPSTQSMAEDDIVWATATHATRKARRLRYIYGSGSAIETIREEATGATTFQIGIGGIIDANGAMLGIHGQVSVLTAGKGFSIKTGANCKMGSGTLVAGTATISTTAVTASSKIFVTDAGGGVLANIGSLSVGTIVANTSFVVNSSNALDTSNFNWLIIEPA
jgi:hypothetical protein